MRFFRYLLLLSFIGLICLIFPRRSFALAKFNTAYQIYYYVQPSGNTHVVFSIKQVNNLSIVYATDFGISISETKISNVKVTDEGVPVKPDILKTLNQTSISFPFANKVVGKDKVHSFTIEYDTSDITSKFGNTWQINIPRLEADENISSQIAILSVPDGFPSPVYIDPKPDIVNGNTYYFNSANLSNKSISAIFGNTQYYKGRLVYHLGNDNLDRISTQIALPPDTSYQTVYISSINPQPLEVESDTDGNLLARYELEPKQYLDVTAEVYFKINFRPAPSLSEVSSKYVAPTGIWNYNDSIFNSPELSNLTTAKSIFDYVTDKMNYDYGKITEKRTGLQPASISLKEHLSAICTDFTNVYIALARKAGIPTREVEGYAISDNPDLKPLSLSQDVLHAWPEYFDKTKNTWVQIDPTWTNTTSGVDYFNKLDFNHIAFVIHGEDITFPAPAGGYKSGTEKTKDISINPITSLEFPPADFLIEYKKQEGNNLIFKVKNTTGVGFSGSVKIEGNNYILDDQQTLSVPPLSEKELWVKVSKTPFFRQDDVPVIININGKQHIKSVTLVSSTNQIALFSGVGILLGTAALASWGLHLRRQKPKSTLYR